MNDTENQNKVGLQVVGSPFNAVKLELAVIVVVGLMLWIVVDSITGNDIAQIGILFGFGVVAAIWLVLRTRYLAQRIVKK